MKFLNLKFNSKELKTIRDALLSDRAELKRLKKDPNFLKELDRPELDIKTKKILRNSKEYRLNQDIYHRTKLIEYIQQKEKLFI
tara:strand:- start:217 stop:468 length:252 start_codon:yes stop_codon:yes gene_type:complete